MTNIDLKKTYKHLYTPKEKVVSLVDVPPLTYLMIDGEGNPNTAPAYVEAVSALYTLAYSVRGLCKEAGEVFTVMPLEGLWTFKGEAVDVETFVEADKDRFIWTMLILQPECVTAEMVEVAREHAIKKKNSPRLADIRLETLHEGDSVQIMHIGPYRDEAENIARLHHHIAANGWTLSGLHHEIYLSDPRKVAPEKMKTVIRQPFTR